MSHFSSIKTKIKDRKILLKALQVLGHQAHEDILLDNPVNHVHEQVKVDVALNNGVGFKWNKAEESYELVAELDVWDLDVPVNRFIDKLTQQYAEQTILNSIEEEGFQVEKREVSDGSVELSVGRWG